MLAAIGCGFVVLVFVLLGLIYLWDLSPLLTIALITSTALLTIFYSVWAKRAAERDRARAFAREAAKTPQQRAEEARIRERERRLEEARERAEATYGGHVLGL